ncbi:hypothetical protein MTO96_012163 [Rhipicephalus appendiculatus]
MNCTAIRSETLKSGTDSSEDDGDPPGQARQPERDGTTITLYFPLPPVFQCCEDGCRAAYNPAVWTSRRQSLVRHLEAEYGIRTRRTVYVCTICGDTLGSRPTTHGCLAGQPNAAPPNLQHRCPSCPRSFLSRRGLYNHEQWHRREAALLARQNVAAGAQPTTRRDGPPQQPDSDSDATPADSAGTTQPRQASPRQAAAPEPPSPVAPSTPQLSGAPQRGPSRGRLPSGAGDLTDEPADQDQQQQQASASPTSSAAAGPLSQVAPPTPLLSGAEDLTGEPADQARRTSSSSDEYASPAAQDSEELPGQTAGPAVGGQPSPDATTPRGGDQGNGSTYGTQEEAADSMGPESAWVLAEETAELRALRRLPVDDEQWARLETILDCAEAAIVEHLRLPNRGSRQTPPRREINPDNAAQIQALYRRNRRRAVRLIADGPSQLCPIDPGTLHDYYTRLWSPATVDTTLLRSRAPHQRGTGHMPLLTRRSRSQAP